MVRRYSVWPRRALLTVLASCALVEPITGRRSNGLAHRHDVVERLHVKVGGCGGDLEQVSVRVSGAVAGGKRLLTRGGAVEPPSKDQTRDLRITRTLHRLVMSDDSRRNEGLTRPHGDERRCLVMSVCDGGVYPPCTGFGGVQDD